MGKTTSIAQVQDLYDLIDLYANLDFNHDGLLGTNEDEVAAEEVAAGDRGGTSSATNDVKDGFLSPWEVAQMRGLKGEEVRSLRIANQIHQATFNDIEALPQDAEINGYTFKAGTALRFHPNGTIAQGVLAITTLIVSDISQPLTIPAEAIVSFKADGELLKTTISRAVHSNGISLPAHTVFWDRGTRVTNETEPIIANGVAYSEFNLVTMCGTLATETELPLLKNGALKVSFPAGTHVNHDPLLKTYYVQTLARKTTIDGISLPQGTEISTVDTAATAIEFRSPEGETIARNGAQIKTIQIRNDRSIGKVIYAQPHPEKAGDTLLKVTGALYRADGTLEAAILAEDLLSPYNKSWIHRTGIEVSLFDDGTLIEGSPECFQRRYPHITLSGKASRNELLAAIRALEQMTPRMRAAVRGMSFGHDVVPHALGGTGMAGFAHPLNGTMYLKKSDQHFHLDADTIIHEAAHLLHLSLQAGMTRRIAAATRHLDLSRPEDLVENEAITRQLFSRSFDARWIRAAGYDFSYSAADLASYWIRYGEYEASAKRGFATSVPADGFLRSYGRVSIWEDIATAVEFISREPETFALLLNEDAYYYDDHHDQKPFARVYRRKYDLLVEYGFIPREVQRKVLERLPTPVDPEMAAFCASLNCP